MRGSRTYGGLAVLVTCLAGAAASAQTPLSAAFTYQGRLDMNGEPLTGAADLQFTLWDAAEGGNPLGAALMVDAVPVADGLFTVELDFGAAVFNGEARWVEISVASPPGGPLTTLTPRQPLTAAPYALQTRGVHVSETGKVGLGTTSPERILHTVGDCIQVERDINEPGVMLKNTFDGTLRAFLGLRSTGPGAGYVSLTDESLARVLYLSQGNAGIGLAGKNKLHVEGDADVAGRLGIGTDEPADALHVHGGDIRADRGDATMSLKRSLTLGGARTIDNVFAELGFQNYDADTSAADYLGASIAAANAGGADSGDLRFSTASEGLLTERMRITHDGNIGIGTTTPATELDVLGTVSATAFVGDGSGLTNLPSSEAPWEQHATGIHYDGGAVGIGTATPTSELDVAGTVTADAFVGDGSGLTNLPVSDVWTRSGEDIHYESGRVGIGTAAPSANLHVVGEVVVEDGTQFDQIQTENDLLIQVGHVWQTFTAGIDGSLVAIELFVAQSNTSSGGTLRIHPGHGLGEPPLATQEYTLPSGTAQWTLISLETPVSLVAGSVYTIDLNPADGPQRLRGARNDPYPDGYIPTSEPIDLAFRTHMRLPGTIRLGQGGGFHAVADADPTVLVRGKVGANGDVDAARSTVGVTAVKLSTGVYKVKFPAGLYADPPVVTVTASDDTTENRYAVLSADVTVSAFHVTIHNQNGALRDSGFNFIALGGR